MLELFRKIFGCWHDPVLDSDATKYNYSEELTQHTLELEKLADAFVKDEKKEIIENIVSAVISDKEKGFVSYIEEAQDSVTGGKFKFIKYRPKK